MEGRALRYVVAAAIVVAVVVVLLFELTSSSGSSLSVSDIQVAADTPSNIGASCTPSPCPAPAVSDQYLVSFLVTGTRRGSVRCTVTVTRHGSRLAEASTYTDAKQRLPEGSWYDSVVVRVPGGTLQPREVAATCR